jgi:hypothetical protein
MVCLILTININSVPVNRDTLKLITLVYGIAIIIISAILHYSVQPGIDNCNSMAGIVSTYTSKDYAIGCHTLSYVQAGSLTSGAAGVGIAIYGLLGKSKMK